MEPALRRAEVAMKPALKSAEVAILAIKNYPLTNLPIYAIPHESSN
jgi:hypothetical protein